MVIARNSLKKFLHNREKEKFFKALKLMSFVA